MSDALPQAIRSGPQHWARSLLAMLRFDWARTRQWAALVLIVQILMGAGTAVMYGFFYPEVTGVVALYIASGTPTLALIPLGFIMLPGIISQERIAGTFDFTWSLPVPRAVQAASIFLIYAGLSLPGTVASLLAATWRYDVSLHVSAVIVPAILLCALMSVSVGFGFALAIPHPSVVGLISNALVFVVLFFSPIVFPASHLPGWLHDVHQVLPFHHMAVVVRAGLTTGLAQDVGWSFAVLAGWTAAGCALAGWVLGRRR